MNDNDDLAIENNRFVLTVNDSDEEIRQRIIQRLKFFRGEWFLDLTEGLPYFQAIFVKGTPADIIEAAFKNRIIGTDGVVTLSRFDPIELDSKLRNLTVSFDVKTINGNTIFINNLEVP